jgi:hypothetical protein
MNDKQHRAGTIVASILQLDAEHGSPLPLGKIVARQVGRDDWSIRIVPGQRWALAPGYRTRLERRAVDDKHWRTVQLHFKGREVLACNVKGTRVDVHFFRPGIWETKFGSDPGQDTITYQPQDFPIGPHADDQVELRQGDLCLPPRSTGPAQGDELRNPMMRRLRTTRPTTVNGPYSVATLTGRP